MNRTKDWRLAKTKSKKDAFYNILIDTHWNSYDSKEEFHDKMKSRAKHLLNNKKSCSCYMCGNPRRFWKDKTLQEKIFDDIENSQDY